MLVGGNVGESESFELFKVGAQHCGIATELGLGEYDTNAHRGLNGPAPQFLSYHETRGPPFGLLLYCMAFGGDHGGRSLRRFGVGQEMMDA
jgi:hypothetical protein